MSLPEPEQGRVLQFPVPKDPHISGQAHCTACQYSWVAVSPIGVTKGFECPQCHALRGIYTYLLSPPEGSQVWTCGCGETLFYVLHTTLICVGCGTYHPK